MFQARRLTFLSLLIAFLVSCGEPGDPTYLFKGDFARYALSNNRYVDTSKVAVTIAPLDGQSESILCANGEGSATIDSKLWEKTPHDGLEPIVFHVLGHCLLGREHREETSSVLALGAPVSIMNSHYVPYFDYPANRDYYLKELFAPVPTLIWP